MHYLSLSTDPDKGLNFFLIIFKIQLKKAHLYQSSLKTVTILPTKNATEHMHNVDSPEVKNNLNI